MRIIIRQDCLCNGVLRVLFICYSRVIIYTFPILLKIGGISHAGNAKTDREVGQRLCTGTQRQMIM